MGLFDKISNKIQEQRNYKDNVTRAQNDYKRCQNSMIKAQEQYDRIKKGDFTG